MAVAKDAVQTAAIAPRLAANAMFAPSAEALNYVLGDKGGTPNPFIGPAATAYDIAKVVPVLGMGLHLGEAINSCR